MADSTFPLSSLDATRSLAPKPTVPETSARLVFDDVLARAQAGDKDAFSALYTQHKRRVFLICLRMVHDSSDAEDLTQETFLQVYRKLASFRGNSAFTTWLHRIAVNTVLMHLRKRVLPIVSLDQMGTSTAEERNLREVGVHDLTQREVVNRLAIDRVADKLAPGYRNAFLLYDVHGLQHHEIANLLGCSLGNSKSQLYKARRVLRRALSTNSMVA